MMNTSRLPADFNLFIATPSAIHAYDQSSRRPLFECVTDGIVNARAAKDNSSLLAIADSQLVILHDPTRGADRKYRLKSREGEPRLLVFSPDSRTLFFSTTLSTAIQAYYIPTGELLPPPQIHSSPPSVLAISADGDILLSASPSPPTMFLQDLRVGGSIPTNLQPKDAASPAVFATFQAGDHSIASSTSFVVGFQDGSLSLFRLAKTSRRASYLDPSLNPSLNPGQGLSLQPTRVKTINKLHRAAMGGITAAEFLPGYKARVVSIGHDGRCRLVDFEGGGRTVASRGRSDRDVLFGGDSSADDRTYEGMETFIAVGTQSGKVMVFNVLGLLIHEVAMYASIVALEWVRDMSAPSILPNRRGSLSPCSAFEDQHEPVLDSVLEAYEESSDEELGTVKRTMPPAPRTGIRSPIRLDGARDLFSPEPRTKSILRRPSDISNGSPVRIDRSRHHTRRQSFIRPRIVTETFKTPE
ncbi:hypothetical protein K458DRAFT_275523, partial [Lentithecium fluviatile CBS 122367]